MIFRSGDGTAIESTLKLPYSSVDANKKKDFDTDVNDFERGPHWRR